jgi:hypothetical protein
MPSGPQFIAGTAGIFLPLSRVVHPIGHMISESLPENEPLALSSELAAITRNQYQALLKASLVPLTHEEASEYDRRRLRIGEICTKLNCFPTA